MKIKADIIISARQAVTPLSDKGCLQGIEMSELAVFSPGGVAVKSGKILKSGNKSEILRNFNARKVVDFPDCVIMPGFVDAHTHPVFAGSRVNEYLLRAKGTAYMEIQAAGGGIISTVKATRKAGIPELYRLAERRILRMINHGTTALEAKSGYGLSVKDEIKMLKVISMLKEKLPAEIVPTFLGAHAIPEEFSSDRPGYIQLVLNAMKKVKSQNLAEAVDVFCEEGAFNLDESEKIFKEALKLGFKIKIHAEEFTTKRCAGMASILGASSCDHLLFISDEDIKIMSRNQTPAVLMPGTPFFLGMEKYAPARKIIENNVIVALATDFNAGSCLIESMQTAVSLACIKMKMTPEEAINAATINSAYALGLSACMGSLQEGKYANLVIMDAEDYREIPYHAGVNLAKSVMIKGKFIRHTVGF
ncbi:MAG: imidazolonepropionase [Firmicutes bacterium]|nr:imidazolonepropionase [Bacillota bacterium]